MNETGSFALFMVGAVVGTFAAGLLSIPLWDMRVEQRVYMAPLPLIVGIVTAAVGARYEADAAYGFASVWLLGAVLLCAHWAIMNLSKQG